MDISGLKNQKTLFIIGIVIIATLFSLWLRLLPMFNLGLTDILSVVGSDDPLYNLRQVEQIIANFPAYNWYDAMSLYPYGSAIYWGSLFPTIIATLCILVGAHTRPEIISVGLLVPPIMGALLVPVMYFIGKVCGDWKTGILSAIFTAVVTGQFYYRSFYGYMDHHIAEVFFATIFCLFYIYALTSTKDIEINLKKITEHKKPLLITGLTGVAYLLGLFTMPTMILMAMVVGVYTLIQVIIDIIRERTSEYLVLINGVTFTIAIIGLFIYGIKHPGLELSQYTIGHVYAYAAIIIATLILYVIGLAFKKGEPKIYASLIGIIVVSPVFLFLFAPSIYNLLISSFFAFFGQGTISLTVQEARGWITTEALGTFNYGLLLFFGGALLTIYNNYKDEHPHQMFALIWSLTMFYSTWQHIRYEYYLAINIALLSAVCVSFMLNFGGDDLNRLITKIIKKPETPDEPEEPTSRNKRKRKSQKKAETREKQSGYVKAGIVIIAIIAAIIFVYSSASLSFYNGSVGGIRMNGDWRESLEWMAKNTPDTGVEYLKIYDQKAFVYPSTAYGVMSWWDYGHMITYIAKRIPNANPFQQGVLGANGSAAFFITEDETTANKISDNIGIRYVITDIEMDEITRGKFWAMATWYNTTLGASPYMQYFLATDPNNPSSAVPVSLINEHYYTTMVSKLHNFDGSMTNASLVVYIEYSIMADGKTPMISGGQQMEASIAHARADAYNADHVGTGGYAAVLSPAIIYPAANVPALQHYRLVHESPTNVMGAGAPDIKYVKIFEYVKGAHITGDGIIEINVQSNTGRNFTYRQQSVNGEFVVPYPTDSSTYGIKTVGTYRIIGTEQTFSVAEKDVMEGKHI